MLVNNDGICEKDGRYRCKIVDDLSLCWPAQEVECTAAAGCGERWGVPLREPGESEREMQRPSLLNNRVARSSPR